MDLTEWAAPATVLSLLTAFAGAVAWFRAQHRQTGTDKQTQREADSKDSNQVFQNASDLIDKYEKALEASRAELTDVKRQHTQDMAELRARADEVERRSSIRIAALEQQVENLQTQLTKFRKTS